MEVSREVEAMSEMDREKALHSLSCDMILVISLIRNLLLKIRHNLGICEKMFSVYGNLHQMHEIEEKGICFVQKWVFWNTKKYIKTFQSVY